MTNRYHITAAAIALATLATTTPAHAEGETLYSIQGPVVCVGSPTDAPKWNIRKAVRYWNSVQSDITLTNRQDVPGCSRVELKTYYNIAPVPNALPNSVAFVDYTSGWGDGVLQGEVFRYPSTTIYFNTARRPAGKQFACKRRNVAIHEMGHALGLPHTDEVGSIMTPMASNSCTDGVTAADLADLAARLDTTP